MPHATFADLYDAVIIQAQRGDFAEAYALITAEGARFPEAASMVLYLRSCMAERVGDRAAALAALSAALDQGHWYGELLLRSSPSWQPLQGEPAFEQLAARSLAMMAAATRDPEPLLVVPAGAPPPSGWPLLLTLHGNGGNPQLSREGWRPAADGWLQVALRSSQAISSQQYVWDDQEQARTDVLDQRATVRAAHPVDEDRVVLAGFSRGAEIALQLALTGALNVQGVVLLGPGGPLSEQPDQWLPLIKGAAGRDLRAAVVIGEDDAAGLVDSALQLAPLLDANGIACSLDVVRGLGHAYPRDGGAVLRRGLDFVTGR